MALGILAAFVVYTHARCVSIHIALLLCILIGRNRYTHRTAEYTHRIAEYTHRMGYVCWVYPWVALGILVHRSGLSVPLPRCYRLVCPMKTLLAVRCDDS